MGVAQRANEFIQLLRMSRNSPTEAVAATLDCIRTTRNRVAEHTGVKVENLKVLEIGPGQLLRYLRCWAANNDAVGIDTDIIPQGYRVDDYVRMLRHSPAIRSVKTLARKALGGDLRFNQALARELGIQSLPRLSVLRMSATEMTFPDGSFDFACSYSAFEHIDNPEGAIAEVKRVLRPGGVAYISIHLYTSHSGCHDPSIMAAGGASPPFWPHLRPQLQHTVHPSAYLNRFSLKQWHDVFGKIMPGVKFVNERQDHEIGHGLRELRDAGELAGYTDEELMTVNLVAIWKKPGSAGTAAAA
jgi:SAM-dependent methyltransferase